MIKIDTKKAILLFFTFLNFMIAVASVIFTLTFAYIMFESGDSLSACFLVFLSGMSNNDIRLSIYKRTLKEDEKNPNVYSSWAKTISNEALSYCGIESITQY